MQEESLLPIYLAFRAYDRVCHRKPKPGYTPSADLQGVEMVVAAMGYLHDLATVAGLREDLAHPQGIENIDTSVLEQKIRDVVAEFVRADGAELHNISALTGGMVAQEVIKVVTKQYVPVDNA